MFKFILVLLIGLSNLRKTTPCVNEYGQCGGIGYSGSTQCCAPSTCVYSNAWYSQCIPSSASSTTNCNSVYSQCDGQNWSGSTCCVDSICTYSSPYYSQCLPPSSSSPSSSSSSTASTSIPSSTHSSSSSSSPSSSSSSTASTSIPSSTHSSSSSSSPSSSSSSTASTSISSSTHSSSSSSSPSSSSSSTASTSIPSSTHSSSSSLSTSSSTTQSGGSCNSVYSQCNGQNWSGSTCCTNSICTYSNPYYSQCLPPSSSSSSSSNTDSTSTPSPTQSSSSSSSSSGSSTGGSTTISLGSNFQAGVTTRYWDCCKASCGWPGKASVTNPVETCAQDGVTPVDPNTQSICAGGTGYMCSNQQPWNVSSTLSYGYAAAYITGESESNWCCACYLLVFTSGPVVGKQMIVQVTNTGGDLGNNQFDLEMPGGGFGLFDGCQSQFPGTNSASWGQQYGGVTQRSDCANLPSALQRGCYWRFDWFQDANNPSMNFQQVTCPTALTANTQCVRL